MLGFRVRVLGSEAAGCSGLGVEGCSASRGKG